VLADEGPVAGASETSEVCLDPPGKAEVRAKLPKSWKDHPAIYEVQRNNVRIVIENIGNKVDPVKGRLRVPNL
jgi:hypothetical protein